MAGNQQQQTMRFFAHIKYLLPTWQQQYHNINHLRTGICICVKAYIAKGLYLWNYKYIWVHQASNLREIMWLWFWTCGSPISVDKKLGDNLIEFWWFNQILKKHSHCHYLEYQVQNIIGVLVFFFFKLTLLLFISKFPKKRRQCFWFSILMLPWL